MGPVIRDPEGTVDLWNVPGEGLTYNDPELSWLSPIAVTGITFPAGSSWGPAYDGMAIVGDANTGQISALPLNAARDAFVLTGGLADLVADTQAERDQLVIGQGFNASCPPQRGLESPNPHIYVSSLINNTIYRIRDRCRCPCKASRASIGRRLGLDGDSRRCCSRVAAIATLDPPLVRPRTCASKATDRGAPSRRWPPAGEEVARSPRSR